MWLLALDIDGTLTGDRAALDQLVKQLRKSRNAGEIYLVLSTGRRLEQVVSGMGQEGLPEPDAVVSQVGTEIYLPPLADGMEPLAAWRDLLLENYDRVEAVSFLDGIAGLVMQPEKFNTDLKTSCFLDRCDDPAAAAAEIERRVEPHHERYQVIWSSGRDLDVLPAASGKGKAIRFLMRHLSLDGKGVIAAGNTGNDATMFAEFRRGIVVANAEPELFEWADTQPIDDVYRAREPFAAGVAEGLAHFGVLG
jgi:hypothetical protein